VGFIIANVPSGFAATIVVAGLVEARRRWYAHRDTPTRLVLTSDGRWNVVVDEMQWRASLVDAVELGPLLAMTLRGDDGTTRRYALLPDSADADELRRLRVWLRHKAGKPPQTSDPPM
ncbi:MAG TPA: protein YgfX, partial [Xanthomonadales bacterium]|nr:protein YgfX [Xanthomonadales bacterium]